MMDPLATFTRHALCRWCACPINDAGLGRAWQHTDTGSYKCEAARTNVYTPCSDPTREGWAEPAETIDPADAAEAETDAFERGWREGRKALYTELRKAVIAGLDGISHE